MLNEKKLQDHILSMEAAAKHMLSEASKIRSMLDVKEKPVQINLTEINLRKRRMMSIKKACQDRLSNKILNH
jgi:hypothetical protein